MQVVTTVASRLRPQACSVRTSANTRAKGVAEKKDPSRRVVVNMLPDPEVMAVLSSARGERILREFITARID